MRSLLRSNYCKISTNLLKPRLTSILARFVEPYLAPNLAKDYSVNIKHRPAFLFQGSIVRSFKHKTMDSTDPIRNVDIDGPGNTFKYILLKLTTTKGEPGSEQNATTLLIRGYSSCAFHSDIYDNVQDQLFKKYGKGAKWKLECLGGGRIKHDHKKIHIYGYSQGFGRADHKAATELIKAAYGGQGYEVTWSNDGY